MTIASPPTATQASPARTREAALIAHCIRVARGQDAAMEPADAQVLALAASLLQHRYPDAAHALSAAAEQSLRAQGAARMPLNALLRSGQIADLPRFKERLLRQLAAP